MMSHRVIPWMAAVALCATRAWPQSPSSCVDGHAVIQPAREALGRAQQGGAEDIAHAIETFERLLRTCDHPRLEADLGRLYAQQGHDDEALLHLRNALYRCRGMGPACEGDLSQIEAAVAALRPNVATLSVDVPSGVHVWIQGVRLPDGETEVPVLGDTMLAIDDGERACSTRVSPRREERLSLQQIRASDRSCVARPRAMRGVPNPERQPDARGALAPLRTLTIAEFAFAGVGVAVGVTGIVFNLDANASYRRECDGAWADAHACLARRDAIRDPIATGMIIGGFSAALVLVVSAGLTQALMPSTSTRRTAWSCGPGVGPSVQCAWSF